MSVRFCKEGVTVQCSFINRSNTSSCHSNKILIVVFKRIDYSIDKKYHIIIHHFKF